MRRSGRRIVVWLQTKSPKKIDIVGLEFQVVGQASDLLLRTDSRAIRIPVQDAGFLVVDDAMVGGLRRLADMEIRVREVALWRSLEQ
jgi:hypothetical protein